MRTVQYASLTLILALLVNMTLLALGKIDPLMFWGVVVVIGLFAYKAMPRFARRTE